jgi:hypothetical protein
MMPLSKKAGCESMTDYILWYAKSKDESEEKINQLFLTQSIEGDTSWNHMELSSGH